MPADWCPVLKSSCVSRICCYSCCSFLVCCSRVLLLSFYAGSFIRLIASTVCAIIPSANVCVGRSSFLHISCLFGKYSTLFLRVVVPLLYNKLVSLVVVRLFHTLRVIRHFGAYLCSRKHRPWIPPPVVLHLNLIIWKVIHKVYYLRHLYVESCLYSIIVHSSCGFLMIMPLYH